MQNASQHMDNRYELLYVRAHVELPNDLNLQASRYCTEPESRTSVPRSLEWISDRHFEIIRLAVASSFTR